MNSDDKANVWFFALLFATIVAVTLITAAVEISKNLRPAAATATAK